MICEVLRSVGCRSGSHRAVYMLIVVLVSISLLVCFFIHLAMKRVVSSGSVTALPCVDLASTRKYEDDTHRNTQPDMPGADLLDTQFSGPQFDLAFLLPNTLSWADRSTWKESSDTRRSWVRSSKCWVGVQALIFFFGEEKEHL